MSASQLRESPSGAPFDGLTDGYVPIWSAETQRWVPGPQTGGGLLPGPPNTGVVTDSEGSALVNAFIVNTNVDVAAAIAGSKIVPNFGAQNVFTTSSIYAGTTTTDGEQAGSIVAVSTSGAAVRGLVSAQFSSDTISARAAFQKARGTRAAKTAVVQADTIGTLHFSAYDGAAYQTTALIMASVSGVVGLGSIPTDLVFSTGAAGVVERMRITSAGVVMLGLNAATTGNLNFPNACVIAGRNAANTGDLNMLILDSANNVIVGNPTSTFLSCRAATEIVFVISGVTIAHAIAGSLHVDANTLAFSNNIGGPVSFMYERSGSATTFSMAVRGQSPQNGTAGNGGLLIVAGGASGLTGGTGLKGGVQVSLASNTNAPVDMPMVEVAEVIAGQRVLALAFGAAITATQMPVNTGDLVAFIANAAAVPTANPVGGGVLYVDAGALKYRGPSGTVTPLAAA